MERKGVRVRARARKKERERERQRAREQGEVKCVMHIPNVRIVQRSK